MDENELDYRSQVRMRAAGWWPIDVSITEAAGLILACALLVGGIVAPLDVSFRAQRAIAVFLFAVVLWLTKPLPLSISSVLSVTLLAALGVVDSFGQAASGFASRLVFFLLLLFLLGGAISKVGIDEHVAARLMSAQSTPRESYGMLSRNVLLLAFLMPSGIARTVTFVPVVSRLNERYDLDSENNFLQSSFLMLGQVNPIASLALMTGGGMALLSSEIIRTTVRPLTWLDWALYMVPPVIVLYLLSAVAIARLYPIDDTETVMTNDGVDVMSRDQHLVGAVMLGTIGLWLTGSIVDFSTIVPPMLAVMVLAAPGVSIITAQDVREANWGILLLFGAVLSLIDVLATTGAMDLLVDSLLGAVPLMAFSRWTALGVVLVGVVGFRLLFSTASACLAIVLPVVITLSETLGVDPMYMSLSVVLVVGATTLLPFHLPTVLIVAERYPELRNRDVFLVGGITLAFAVLTVYLSWTLYWPMLA